MRQPGTQHCSNTAHDIAHRTELLTLYYPQAEEAAIDALLAEELEEVTDFTVEGAALPAADGDEEVVALDDAEVEAYIKALQVRLQHQHAVA